jgi:hypothetical protein
VEQLKVGGETQAYCTSCRTMREHVIVAMAEGKPAKVECSECHKQHLFRAGPPGTKTASGSRTSTARSKKAAEAPRQLPQIDIAAQIAGREVRGYDPKVGFAVGDVVKHPSFGVGLVTGLPGAQKMEVTFESGAKLLAHDRNAAVASTLTRPTRREDDDRRLPSDAPPPRVPAR